jgi:hypothetical protein
MAYNLAQVWGGGPPWGWLKVDLGSTYALDDAHFFNYNGSTAGVQNRGVQTARIWYATTDTGNNSHNDHTAFDSTGWTQLGGTHTFTEAAEGDVNQTTPDVIEFGGVQARYVVFEILSNYGGPSMGIGEVQFFALDVATAVDDTAVTPYQTPANLYVLANDSGEGIGMESFTSPATNAAGAGVGTVTDGGGYLTYTPANGFTGIAYFQYAITNAYSADTGTVAVTVLHGVFVEYTDTPAVVQDSDGDTGGSQTVNITDFSPVANDLLIVAFAQEHNNGESSSGINNVKYGGTDMTLAVTRQQLNPNIADNMSHSSIWYIDPANGTGNITFDTGGTSFSRYSVSVVLVRGTTSPVVFDDASASSVTVNATLTAGPLSVDEGSFMIDSFHNTDHEGSFTAKGLSESGGTVLRAVEGAGNAVLGASYLVSGSEQSLSTTWTRSIPDEASTLTLASFRESPSSGTVFFIR